MEIAGIWALTAAAKGARSARILFRILRFTGGETFSGQSSCADQEGFVRAQGEPRLKR